MSDMHEADPPTQNSAIAQFILDKGGQVKAARLLGVSQGMVSKWLNGHPIPADRAKAIETLTGGELTRSQLRPDLWG